MFLVASIAMLRERTTGTLERLMALPIAKTDVLFGYGLAFGALAALQAVIICTVGFLVLGLEAAHGAWLVGLLAVTNATLGMALGLFVSAFAQVAALLAMAPGGRVLCRHLNRQLGGVFDQPKRSSAATPPVGIRTKPRPRRRTRPCGAEGQLIPDRGPSIRCHGDSRVVATGRKAAISRVG
jgi:hypothetical protein